MSAITELLGPIRRDIAGDVLPEYAAAEAEYGKRGIRAGRGSSLKKLRKVLRIAAGQRPARITPRREVPTGRPLYGAPYERFGRTYTQFIGLEQRIQKLHPTKGWRYE
jgi:hypothetical protein